MSKKNKKRGADLPAHADTPVATTNAVAVAPPRGPLVLLGLLMALFAARPLVVSDAPGGDYGVFLITGACALLAGWAILGQLRLFLQGQPMKLYLGPVGMALGVLLLAFTASCLWVVQKETGDARAAINMTWKWVALIIGFFLARQLVREERTARAVVSVMLGLSVLLAVGGFYQYQVSHPAAQAEYAADPEAVLQREGILGPDGAAATVGSPIREQYEARLQAIEPSATFALTNSLAGALAPWLIVALGIGLTLLRPGETAGSSGAEQAGVSRLGNPQRWLVLAGLLAAALLLGGCLVLTKSRTVFLAVGGGVVLLLLYGGLFRRQLDWKIPLGLAGAAVLLALAATLSGGLDVEVVSEAPKSVLYRLEYWRSTAAMIADHPWLGVGPGCFQANYAHYKLPQASEMVADPHNFLLEVWATGGLFALLSLLAAGGLLAWQVARNQRASAAETASRNTQDEASAAAVAVKVDPQDAAAGPHAGPLFVYLGGAMGVLLSFPISLMVGVPNEFEMLLLGLLFAGLTVAALHPWVVAGRLPLAALAIGLIVLLVNFLAAGGISFDGVGQNVWLLAALLLNLSQPGEQPRRLQPTGAIVTAGVAFGLMGLCFFTLYQPVLYRAAAMPTIDMAQQGPEAYSERLRAAAAADPYSPDPWAQLATLAALQWQVNPNNENLKRYERTAAEYLRHDPQSWTARAELSRATLRMYRRQPDSKLLLAALDQQREAVARYPSSAMAHAQLAWLLHLAGNDAAAQEEAASALALDKVHPHQEQKLKEQSIYDAAPPPEGPGATNAEEVMQQMVKASSDVAGHLSPLPNSGWSWRTNGGSRFSTFVSARSSGSTSVTWENHPTEKQGGKKVAENAEICEI
ncbi:O-antigen ligase family protein [Lignipirellula cremea]|uniref:O-Antigen ligase n=1 Tax=Lignipirellula cremea TaxID=2528010 RepID=A0A518DQ26_9BACT|nr:O-antigen ligase family protein [Lignipirellula cremea]QDU93946.1 O-Antigen ligase [Lignipirellula cremea]